ncbi:MAG TPA: cyclic nucleotide-binding domain-containing protein [Solirubrobacteraceae bacterium]|nr:cyclic nucleotide-binding domain-containing protein [Solirubrobacteraceae bacterium]
MTPEQAAVDVPAHVVDYLSSHNTLTLATASPSGVPHASTFLYVNDGSTLYFWTRPGTVTARHVEQNPVVSFAIDEYTKDLRQTRGVQGSAECNVVLNGETIARVADLFGQKFPELSPGTTMSISFFRIVPTELQFIDNTEAGGRSEDGTFGADFSRERAYSVFADLPFQRTDSVLGELQTVKVDAGEVVVRQGGPADKFFILVDGAVEVEQQDESGATSVSSLGPGHFFGEVAIMRGTPRAATVRATAPSTLIAVDRDVFRDLVAQSLGMTADFDQVVRARLRAGDEES